jgi:hypothetical protein
MHIPPFDNHNQPIVDVNHSHVPLTYFNIVKLKAGATFDYRVPGYETCVVPATGTVTVDTAGRHSPISAIAAPMSGTVTPKASMSPPTPPPGSPPAPIARCSSPGQNLPKR